MKTAFGFRLRLRRYDQVKTGSSESQAEAEELNLTNYKVWQRALWLVYPSPSGFH